MSAAGRAGAEPLAVSRPAAGNGMERGRQRDAARLEMRPPQGPAQPPLYLCPPPRRPSGGSGAGGSVAVRRCRCPCPVPLGKACGAFSGSGFAASPPETRSRLLPVVARLPSAGERAGGGAGALAGRHVEPGAPEGLPHRQQPRSGLNAWL